MKSSKNITIKKVTKSFGIIFSVVLFILLILCFLYGPLLPWSIVRPGFKSVETNSATIFYKDNNYLSIAELYQAESDKIISNIEDLYDLPQHHKVRVFIVNTKDLSRYLPWGSKAAGGLTLQIGDTVYINLEKILAQNRNPLEYLRHELVHEIIYQNSGFLNAFNSTKTPVFSEGFPVFFGGPTYYESRDDFLSEFHEKDIVIAKEGNRAYQKIGESNSASFNYTLYGEFISYLVKTYSQEKLNDFLHKWINDPGNFRSQFKEVFGSELSEVQKEFHEQL